MLLNSFSANLTAPEPLVTAAAGLVSFQIRYIIHVVIFVTMCAVVSVLGIIANVVNAIVFLRQGFHDSINISLMGLAVADFMCVLTMFWISFSASPLFVSWDLPFHEMDVPYATGGWPRIYFIRVSSFITAFITLERCLCIALPLKIKDIISPMKTKVFISSIYAVMTVVLIPSFFINRLKWLYSEARNRTLLTLVYSEDKVIVETAIYPVYGVGLPLAALATVMTCSVVLVVQLNKKSTWRHRSVASSKLNVGTSSVKDKKVVKMVTLIAVIFIVCYLPGAISFVAMSFEPEFSFTGRYVNLYYITWAIIMLLENLCSSVNIFVYYNMSSKYKITLAHTFCCCSKGNGSSAGHYNM